MPTTGRHPPADHGEPARNRQAPDHEDTAWGASPRPDPHFHEDTPDHRLHIPANKIFQLTEYTAAVDRSGIVHRLGNIVHRCRLLTGAPTQVRCVWISPRIYALNSRLHTFLRLPHPKRCRQNLCRKSPNKTTTTQREWLDVGNGCLESLRHSFFSLQSHWCSIPCSQTSTPGRKAGFGTRRGEAFQARYYCLETGPGGWLA